MISNSFTLYPYNFRSFSSSLPTFAVTETPSNYYLAILLHSQSIRITSGVFPPRSLCSLWRRLLQLCGLLGKSWIAGVWHFIPGMIPGVKCQSAFNLRVTAVRVQFESRRFADTHRLTKIYMVLRGLYGLWPGIWLRRLRCWVGRTSIDLLLS
jgi:hypothetical protein